MKKLFLTLCFLAMATVAWCGSNVTFQWDANSENDLAGYKLYRSATSGDYTGSTPIDIPLSILEDANSPTYTEENIPDGTWYWVATAYDTAGNESGYSNQVTAMLDATAPAPPKELSIFKKIIAYIERYYNGYTVSIKKTEPSG